MSGVAWRAARQGRAVLGGWAKRLIEQEYGNPSSTMAGLSGALLGAGNPLLDISAVVDTALLDKYGVGGGP